MNGDLMSPIEPNSLRYVEEPRYDDDDKPTELVLAMILTLPLKVFGLFLSTDANLGSWLERRPA